MMGRYNNSSSMKPGNFLLLKTHNSYLPSDSLNVAYHLLDLFSRMNLFNMTTFLVATPSRQTLSIGLKKKKKRKKNITSQ